MNDGDKAIFLILITNMSNSGLIDALEKYSRKAGASRAIGGTDEQNWAIDYIIDYIKRELNKRFAEFGGESKFQAVSDVLDRKPQDSDMP